MKKFLAVLILFLGIGLMSFSNNAPTPSDIDYCTSETRPFYMDEYAKYDIYYNWKAVWMYAGYATFTTEKSDVNGREAIRVVSLGQTSRKFDWAFKVRDRYETFLDPNTLRPLRFIRDLKEGKYSKFNEYFFNPEENTVWIKHRIRKNIVRQENVTVEINECTHDLLSAVYNFRCIDYGNMQIGDKVFVDVFIDGAIYPIEVEYFGKENIETDLGTFRCVKFSPKLLKSNIFEGDEKLYVWSTDDDNRLPIYMETPLSVGYAKAYIASYEGLKHSMDARVD